MTREEAITALGDRNNLLWGMSKEEQKYYSEALDIAISALTEELSEDGTLMVHVADGSKVKRVFVMGDNIFGGLYYPDSAENKGEWIYDKGIENWRCSRCGKTPPPTGYVGKADFMATHFKFCNHCGADMREPKDILHKAIDNTTFAEEAYPNIKEELHKAVDMAESEE